MSRKPEPLIDQGFGVEARNALARRRQWLLSQGLAQLTPDRTFRAAPDLLVQLRQRDLRQAGAALSKQLGLTYMESREGDRISSTYERAVHLASGRFALMQMAKEFTLVPWQQRFERIKGQSTSGYWTSAGLEWDYSRSRKGGLEIS